MPAKSQAQANLMRGATFPLAQIVRKSMSHAQMHDFAVTKSANLPTHVKKVNGATAVTNHPHRNLGTYLHPQKSR